MTSSLNFYLSGNGMPRLSRKKRPLNGCSIVVVCQSKEASILWSHQEETRELPGERDNARNNARCMQATKATHGLDGQHQDVDRTLHGRVSQNDGGQG